VVAALTDSVKPQGHLKDMRRRDPELAKGWGQIATPLSIATTGGLQNLNCANTEGLRFSKETAKCSGKGGPSPKLAGQKGGAPSLSEVPNQIVRFSMTTDKR